MQDDKDIKAQNIYISTMGLSTRAYNVLTRESRGNLTTLADILRLGRRGLREIKDFGQGTYIEIESKVESLGYKIK